MNTPGFDGLVFDNCKEAAAACNIVYVVKKASVLNKKINLLACGIVRLFCPVFWDKVGNLTDTGIKIF